MFQRGVYPVACTDQCSRRLYYTLKILLFLVGFVLFVILLELLIIGGVVASNTLAKSARVVLPGVRGGVQGIPSCKWWPSAPSWLPNSFPDSNGAVCRDSCGDIVNNPAKPLSFGVNGSLVPPPCWGIFLHDVATNTTELSRCATACEEAGYGEPITLANWLCLSGMLGSSPHQKVCVKARSGDWAHQNQLLFWGFALSTMYSVISVAVAFYRRRHHRHFLWPTLQNRSIHVTSCFSVPPWSFFSCCFDEIGTSRLFLLNVGLAFFLLLLDR